MDRMGEIKWTCVRLRVPSFSNWYKVVSRISQRNQVRDIWIIFAWMVGLNAQSQWGLQGGSEGVACEVL